MALRLARKFLPGLAPNESGRMIEVLDLTTLGPKGSVFVLRCGPRVLIVGATGNQLTTLAEIADPDEIEQYARLANAKAQSKMQWRFGCTGAKPAGRDLKGHVDGMLEKIDDWKATG